MSERIAVVGNPAVIVGYQTNIEARASGARTGVDELPRTPRAKRSLDVGGCELWRLPQFSDLRGELTVLDFDTDLPFDPARTFLVFGVPTDRVRGEHAHHRCEQFLIAAHGAASVAVDDGRQRAEVSLDDPSVGLYIPPMTWRTMYKFQPDTTLIVMASMPYDPDDYIRDYESFLKQVAGA